MQERIEEQFLKEVLASEQVNKLLEAGENIIDQAANFNRRSVLLKLANNLPPGHPACRTGFYEASFAEDGLLSKDRLVYHYRVLSWVNPHYRVRFLDGVKRKIAGSEPNFYKVQQEHDSLGLSAARLESYFTSEFGESLPDTHSFQASYAVCNRTNMTRGELIYMVYSNPCKEGLEERRFVRADGREFRVASNARYNVQLSDTGLYRLEFGGQDNTERVLMFCLDSVDLDSIERIITADGDDWKMLERELWPVSYVVEPTR